MFVYTTVSRVPDANALRLYATFTKAIMVKVL